MKKLFYIFLLLSFGANAQTILNPNQYYTKTIGDIYNKSSWTTGTLASDFTNSGFGTAPTVTSNKIILVGSGAGTEVLSYVNKTCLDNFTYAVDYRFKVTSSGDSGPLIKMLSTNTGSVPTASITAQINHATGADFGKIFYTVISNGTPVVYKSTQIIPAISVNDSLRIQIYNAGGSVVVSANNFTTGTQAYFSFIGTFAFGDPAYIPNTSKFSIIPGNGTYEIDRIQYKSDAPVRPNFLVVGHSYALGSYAGIAMNRWGIQIGAEISAGSGDVTQSVLDRMPEITNIIKPKVVYLWIGVNDISFSIPTGTWQANYASIVSQLTTAGIQVVPMLALPNNGVSVATLNSYISSTYPTTYIDTYTPYVSTGTTFNPAYTSDGTHPNPTCTNLIVAQIMATQVYQNYATPQFKLYAPVPPIFNSTDGNAYITKTYVDKNDLFKLNSSSEANYPGTVSNGDGTSSAIYNLRYIITNGAEFAGIAGTTPMWGVGFNNQANFTGSSGTSGGRQWYLFDKVSSKNVIVADASDRIWFGNTSANGNYTFRVATVATTSANTMIEAAGTIASNYQTSGGNGINFNFAGTNVFTFSSQPNAQYGGTNNANSGTNLTFTNDLTSSFMGGMNQSNEFFWGPSNTNYSLWVKKPTGGVTGAIHNADGSMDMNTHQIHTLTAGTSNTDAVNLSQISIQLPTVSSTTLTLSVSSYYVYTGSGSTWTLPVLTNGLTYHIKNRGSGNLVINSNAGGNDIYDTSAVSTITLAPGAATILNCDATFFNRQ